MQSSEHATYEGVRAHAGWFDPAMGWTSFRGAKAADVLNGLVTNDVSTLGVGESQSAAALSPKGKLVCDMIVWRTLDDVFHVGVPGAAAASWLDLVRKYVNPRLSAYADESARVGSIVIVGPAAAKLVEPLRASLDTAFVTLLARPGSDPFVVVLAPHDQRVRVAELLAAHDTSHGDDALWQLLRIEGGWPLFGVDMDENTIPQEANLDALGAISFTKGCYTGQETVARIHFRGHVNRHLRGLSADTPLVSGSTLADANGKAVGDVRSVATSPRFGHIAMAMVRREVAPGDLVSVTSPDGVAGSARVLALPFS